MTFDEPESHLNPSMKRELLPNLLKPFLSTQLMTATHSPSVIASSPEPRVYALVFDEDHRFKFQYLETMELSVAVSQTLRQILGVPIAVRVWVENMLLGIAEKYKDGELTFALLDESKEELISNNLRFLLPGAFS